MQESTSPKTVLLVEDNPGDVFLLQRACERVGVTEQIQVARDGEEAFAYLSGSDEFADRSKYPWPSILITDLKMPKLDGLELFKQVRSLPGCRDLRVSILCASATDAEMSEAALLGVHGVFIKPLKFEEFDGIVKGIFEQTAPLRAPFPASNQTNLNRGTLSA